MDLLTLEEKLSSTLEVGKLEILNAPVVDNLLQLGLNVLLLHR